MHSLGGLEKSIIEITTYQGARVSTSEDKILGINTPQSYWFCL